MDLAKTPESPINTSSDVMGEDSDYDDEDEKLESLRQQMEILKADQARLRQELTDRQEELAVLKEFVKNLQIKEESVRRFAGVARKATSDAMQEIVRVLDILVKKYEST